MHANDPRLSLKRAQSRTETSPFDSATVRVRRRPPIRSLDGHLVAHAIVIGLLLGASSGSRSQSREPMTIVRPPPAPVAPIRSNPKVLEGTCQKPEYPNAAVRAELEGVTKTRFDIDASGRVVGMIIVKSSGHDALDAATLAALRTCQFTPGTYDGRPILTSAFIELAWKLEDAAPGASAPQR